MNLSLVVLSEGKASGQAIPIKLSQFIIGRDPQCHLRPASPIISKRHCALITKNNKVFLRDFDSTNGTFVNEEKLEGERELKNGDVIKLGPILFKVQLEVTPAVDKPTPLPANRKGDPNEDDAAAALLLTDDGTIPASSSETGDDEIPSGTTMMDMPSSGFGGEVKKEEEKPEETRGEKAKTQQANTATAAAAILAKYQRRPRP